VGSVGTPNTLPADSAGIVGTPNTVPSDSAGIIAAPISLTSATAAALPRSLTPMVEFDFAAKRYVKDGVAVAFEDIFTYTRASSATFTNRRAKKNGGYEYFLDTDYVGSVTNSITYSEDFSDSDWVPTFSTSTVNQLIAPDGTLTANKITYPVASYGWVHQNQYGYTNNDVVTFSAYYKAGSITKVVHNFYRGNVDAYIKVDLLSGAILNSVNTIESSVVNVGDGWYKLSVTALVSVAAGAKAQVARQEGAELTSVGYIYAWGAQVTESAKVLPYVKTLDVAVTKTFAETLRTEYDAVTGKNLGALIEGGSTNLCTGSEDLSLSASWSIVRTTLTINASIAPDGTFSADKIAPLATNQSHYIIISQTTVVSPSKAAVSFYVKPAGYNFFQIGSGQTSSEFVTFDLQSGTISETGSGTDESDCSIKPAGNGFYRVSVSIQPSATGSVFSGAQPSGALGWQPVVAGDGTSGVYIWGGQLEAQPFATSYIRTEGAAVSRSGDVLSVPASVALATGELTARVSFRSAILTASAIDYAINHDGLDGSSISIFTFGVDIYTKAGTDSSENSGFNAVVGVQDNFTLTYKDQATKSYLDGVQGNGNATAGFFQPDFSGQVYIGSSGASSRLDGHISKFSTYDQVLTQQEITLL
jgi:hypothetical protein